MFEVKTSTKLIEYFLVFLRSADVNGCLQHWFSISVSQKVRISIQNIDFCKNKYLF